MKIGFDIHGVIDSEPEYFSNIIRHFKGEGVEIHILTGAKVTDKMLRELKSYQIEYDHLFSILDYHSSLGTKMWQDYKDDWWIDDDLWNRTKGEYCLRNNIDFHIDDTKMYGNYFKTPFAHLTKDGVIELKGIGKEDPILKAFKGYTNYKIIEI